MLANPESKTIPIVLPTTNMPGQKPQEGGGRIINAFVESLGEKGPSEFKLVRVPGMVEFGTTNETSGSFRGAHQVNSLLYTVWSAKVNTHTSSGGAGTDLTNALTGTDLVFMARNSAPTPDLAIVSPANGAFVASTTTVSAYPDSDVGAPNSVVTIAGYFVFGYGDGGMRSSGINTTAINTLDYATAESKPDTLYRVMRRGRTLLAMGSGTIEFWDLNDEASGFPFSWTATLDRGLIHRYAAAGDDEGFANNGIFFVADDCSVQKLDGFASQKISPPDLDRLIEAVADKETIVVSCYISQGHPFVQVRCADWCWEYDVNTQRWHERKSYFLSNWRGIRPFRAFDVWMCGSSHDANLYEIDKDTYTEDAIPLVVEIETAPMGNFPYGARVNRLDLWITGGVGRAAGTDPIETDPHVDIAISSDLGLSWSNYVRRAIGPQGRSPNVMVKNLGLCGPKGIKFRFRFSDPVHFALMGGAIEAVPLRN